MVGWNDEDPALPMTTILPGLFLGDHDDAKNFFRLKGSGIILSVHENRFGVVPEAAWMPYLVPDPDDPPYGLRADGKALDAIAAAAHEGLRQRRNVLLHCNAGIERSPLATAWYLATHHSTTFPTFHDAYSHVRHKRPIAQDRIHWLTLDDRRRVRAL